MIELIHINKCRSFGAGAMEICRRIFLEAQTIMGKTTNDAMSQVENGIKIS